MMASLTLETRLAEFLMSQLDPCDLGDGIEVVHEVESLEVEMDCDLGDEQPALVGHCDADQTLDLTREAVEALEAIAEEAGTLEFARFSAPYERIELSIQSL
jgi:hypothetical protein